MLIARCCHNQFGHFVSMYEYGKEVRRGFIAIPEGLKGEGWRRFATMLREASSKSSISGVENKVGFRRNSSSP